MFQLATRSTKFRKFHLKHLLKLKKDKLYWAVYFTPFWAVRWFIALTLFLTSYILPWKRLNFGIDSFCEPRRMSFIIDFCIKPAIFCVFLFVEDGIRHILARPHFAPSFNVLSEKRVPKDTKFGSIHCSKALQQNLILIALFIWDFIWWIFWFGKFSKSSNTLCS